MVSSRWPFNVQHGNSYVVLWIQKPRAENEDMTPSANVDKQGNGAHRIKPRMDIYNVAQLPLNGLSFFNYYVALSRSSSRDTIRSVVFREVGWWTVGVVLIAQLIERKEARGNNEYVDRTEGLMGLTCSMSYHHSLSSLLLQISNFTFLEKSKSWMEFKRD